MVPFAGNDTVAGACSGFVAGVVTCPLDVVKTRLQAQRVPPGHPAYQGGLTILLSAWKQERLRGLFRGLSPTILGYLPTWAIYFTVYNGIKRHFGEPPLGGLMLRDKIYPASQVKGYQPLIQEHPMSLYLFSAMIAGATTTTITNPLWFMKTRFMTQSPDSIRYRGIINAGMTIYRSEGIGAFYRGLIPNLLGIFHPAIQFPLYEQLKLFANQHPTISANSIPYIMFCSVVSKMTASIITYPHEVIRTRLQTQQLPLADDASSDGMVKSHLRRGVIYTTRKIIIKEGWTALYKGLSVNLMRTVPSSVVTMLTYELTKKRLDELWPD